MGVLAVTERRGQMLISFKNLDMLDAHAVGFLANIFAPFGELDVSVDLVATSQSAVSLTLDHIPGGADGDVFAETWEVLKKHDPMAPKMTDRRVSSFASLTGS